MATKALSYLLLTVTICWYSYEGFAQPSLPKLSFDRLSDSGYMDNLTIIARQHYRKLQAMPSMPHNDTLRFITLFDLGRLYQWRTTHRDSASYFGGELVQQAQYKKNIIYEIAGKFLLAAAYQDDENRLQEALRLNLEILELTDLSQQSFLNLIDIRTYLNLVDIYAKLHDSVNSVRFLNEARRRIGYLQESDAPPSTFGRIVNAIFNKVLGPVDFYSSREAVEFFTADIDHRLTSLKRQTQSSNLIANRWSYEEVVFAEDQSVYEALIYDRYKSERQTRFIVVRELYVLLTLFICIITLLIYAVRLRKRRAEANRQLTKERQEANARISQTQEAERQRIGRDLHDGVGVELAVLRMRLSMLADEEADSTLMIAAVGDLDRISREVREVAHSLTSAELGQGLVSSLRQLVDRLATVYPQIEINFMAHAITAMNPAIEQAVYAMAKELLNNALKHAKPSVIDIEIYLQSSRFYLRVGDNGQGYNPRVSNSSSGIGLNNLRATAQKLGGQFTVVQKPDGGILSEVWVRPPQP